MGVFNSLITGVISTVTSTTTDKYPLKNPIEEFYNKYSYAPSNSEVVWTGLQFQPVETSTPPFERVFLNLYQDSLGGTTQAAKGYLIINALARGASRKTKFNENANKYPELSVKTLDTLPEDKTDGGPTIVGEFAGRVFYAGFTGSVVGGDARSPNLQSFIFFTQLIKSNSDFSKCYQEGDPTSRDSFEVVDTDGGFIRVSGCQSIVRIFNIGSILVILGSNGVWALSGGSDYGFSASNYKLDRISNFGCSSKHSVVEENGRLYYWGDNSIYVVTQAPTGEYVVESASDNITTLYNNIPSESKRDVAGAYDPVNKTINWVYRVGTLFDPSGFDSYELKIDMTLKAFYLYHINKASNVKQPAAFYPFSGSPFKAVLQGSDVISGTDDVMVSTDTVVISEYNSFGIPQTFRYLCAVKDGTDVKYSFGRYVDTDFVDWASVFTTGIDAYAYLITGGTTINDSGSDKRIKYFTVNLKSTESGDYVPNTTKLLTSGCKFQCRWGWNEYGSTIHPNKRWSEQVQVYRLVNMPKFSSTIPSFYDNLNVVSTKNKVRGYGEVFSLDFTTEPGKNCHLLGWSIEVDAE